jgi:hypothetical protein
MISATSSTDPVGSAAETTPKKSLQVKAILGEFDKLLKANLAPDQSNQVSEEELFAAVVQERLEALKGKDAAVEFAKALDNEMAALQAGDGFVPMEQATLNALKGMVKGGKLTEEEGSQVYSESFAAAQLDGNTGALFDSRGGPGDPTMAMATLDIALKQARTVLEKLAAGESNLELKSLATASANGKGSLVGAISGMFGDTGTLGAGDFTPNGTAFDGPEGFLFKPVTNNESKLAVLLGQKLTGNISSVMLKDSLNNVIEEGRLQTEGIKETGREKWVFSKQGGQYPKDLTVEVTLASGEVQRYKIPDPSKRYD